MIKRIFFSCTITSSIMACFMFLTDVMLYAWYESAISMCSLVYLVILFFHEHSFVPLAVGASFVCVLSLLHHNNPFIPLAYIIPLFIAHHTHARRYVVHAWHTYALTIMLCLCVHVITLHILSAEPIMSSNNYQFLAMGGTSLTTLMLLTSGDSRQHK